MKSLRMNRSFNKRCNIEVGSQEYRELLQSKTEEKKAHTQQVDDLKMQLEKAVAKTQVLQAENLDLEDRIQQIMNLTSLSTKLEEVNKL